MMKIKKENRQKFVKFTKEQIIHSKHFTGVNKDILVALLQEEFYTLDEAKALIEEFKKGQVK